MTATRVHKSEFDTNTKPRIRNSDDRLEYKFDAMLAREGQRFIFIDYLFEVRGGNLCGAVTTSMRPISVGEAEREKKKYRDPEESPLRWLYEEEDPQKSWTEWIEAQFDYDGLRVIYDPSYQDKYGEQVKRQASMEGLVDKSDIVFIECVGGGRLSSSRARDDFDRIYDDELFRLALEAEKNGLDSLY